MSNLRLVETTVERTARMLAKEYGIRVVWQGTDAKTDGKTITLPVLPPDAPPELLEAVQGYLDHETAHILFTDFTAMNDHPEITVEQFDCINAIEDVRVEAAITEVFPGAPYNLRKVHDWIGAQVQEHWEDLSAFRRACIAYFYFSKFGENDSRYQVVDEATRAVVAECVEAVGPSEDIKSTKDSIAAGLRMWDVLREAAQEEQKEREARAAQGILTLQTADGKPLVVSVSALAAAISKDAKELMDALARGMSAPTDTGYTHGLEEPTYLVYSTSADTVSTLPAVSLEAAGAQLQAVRSGARGMTSVIKAKLVNSLRAMSHRRWVGGKDEGRLDTKKLYRAAAGSNLVYKALTDKIQLDTVVGMAIDHSGSMAGYKLDLAGQAAIVLGDALNAIHVPFMVYGYSTTQQPVPAGDLSAYARWTGLWIRYYRDFQESWAAGALRLAQASGNAQSNTLDGESIKHGVRRLLARPEKRKILLVLNDGQPYPGGGHVGRCQQYLHDVVAASSKAGVEVIAIGVADRSVRRYYPHSVVINSLSDLVAQPLTLLDKMLRENVRYK